MSIASLSTFLLAVGLIIWKVEHTSATCYMPNGTAVLNDAFQPCNQTTQFSMCCGTNWTNGFIEVDVCLPNGLCLNHNQDGSNTPLYWRDTCTDPTWKSPNCIQNLCSTQVVPWNYGGVRVAECADGSWCCGATYAQCCQNKQGVVLAATIGVSTSTSTAASSPTSSPTTSPTMSASSTASTTSMPSDGLSSPAKMGIGIGVGIGVTLGVILAAMAVIWVLRRRRQLRRMPKDSCAAPTREPGLYDTSRDANGQYELDEGRTGRGRWELQ
jgi:hypothetical protein